MERVKQWAKRLEFAELCVGTVFIAIFVLTIIVQVFARYMRITVLWTEEVGNFSFVWSVFLGAAAMVNRKAHFRFTMLMDRMSPRSQLVLSIIINLFMLSFEVLFTYYGWCVAQRFWNNVLVILTWMKKGVVYLALPISGATMAIYTITHLADDVMRLKGIKEAKG